MRDRQQAAVFFLSVAKVSPLIRQPTLQVQRIINIDESLVSCTDARKYSWQQRGLTTMVTASDRMNTVSLILGVSNRGELFCTVNRGANNGKTVLLFILKLILELDA
jgi:hypothetical protein